MALQLAYAKVTLIHHYLVVIPLQHFYIRGWWRNLPIPDICAQLTQYRSEFWSAHSEACADVIANHFDAILVYAHFFLYVCVVVSFVFEILRAIRRCLYL
jgi:hypothetical protein|uniref:Uncharacterized protein n=1 Tax=viral metagenome TaxID=1070528 RepID=A0A6C0IXJ6_9ZZZZ